MINAITALFALIYNVLTKSDTVINNLLDDAVKLTTYSGESIDGFLDEARIERTARLNKLRKTTNTPAPRKPRAKAKPTA